MIVSFTEFLEDQSKDLEERKIIIKVNSKGRRRRKVQCPPGRVFKGGKCVTPTGKERLGKKLATKRMNRTKKAKGAGFKKRVNFRRQKAMKRRKSMGL